LMVVGAPSGLYQQTGDWCAWDVEASTSTQHVITWQLSMSTVVLLVSLQLHYTTGSEDVRSTKERQCQHWSDWCSLADCVCVCVCVCVCWWLMIGHVGSVTCCYDGFYPVLCTVAWKAKWLIPWQILRSHPLGVLYGSYLFDDTSCLGVDDKSDTKSVLWAWRIGWGHWDFCVMWQSRTWDPPHFSLPKAVDQSHMSPTVDIWHMIQSQECMSETTAVIVWWCAGLQCKESRDVGESFAPDVVWFLSWSVVEEVVI